MTIIPRSLLTANDLFLLGNNFPPRRPARRMSVAAVNRSLALHDERIDRLYRHAGSSTAERLRARPAA